MNADEFVKALALLAPSEETLKLRGLSEVAVERVRKSYICVERPNVERREDNPLLDLLTRYDTTTVEIGMVILGLNNHCYEYYIRNLKEQSKIAVGVAEVDPIVIYLPSGEIQLLDHARIGYVMCMCAVDGSHFLDALLLVAAFVPPHPYFKGVNWTKEQISENNKAACVLASQCAKAAGVDEQRCGLYRMLLGCD
jgi:hypothetical protein